MLYHRHCVSGCLVFYVRFYLAALDVDVYLYLQITYDFQYLMS